MSDDADSDERRDVDEKHYERVHQPPAPGALIGPERPANSLLPDLLPNSVACSRTSRDGNGFGAEKSANSLGRVRTAKYGPRRSLQNKKITALVTLIVLFCYLLISGAAIPTQRAFVMTGIVFVAVLIDRLRISMRICALAAMVVLVLDPASLVGVSFQMSFGAVVALIAVYEKWGAQMAHLFHRGGFGRKALGYCGAVAVTTVVATVGTEPFAIYHFHHLVLYSPLANVIAVPISAMWTLPWGVVACLLMPFGLEALALTPMGWGIDVTIQAFSPKGECPLLSAA